MDNKEIKEENIPLASEMYKDLQKHDKFKMWVIIGLLIALLCSIAGNIAQSIYHDYQWSQFETIVVDSGDGGNANYVGGENTGGIFNGENSSSAQEEGQNEGRQN